MNTAEDTLTVPPTDDAAREGRATRGDARDANQPARQRIRRRQQAYHPGWWARLTQRIERSISRLSVKNNFWHRVCSWIFLPLAFRSGIKVSKITDDAGGFSMLLPFRRFNRNWYSAMAGAALLANSEVAGGMYMFKRCGGDYTVVCKHLDYKFLRPCVGPALYRVQPREDIEETLATKGEFNIDVDMAIVQMVHSADEKERRVGTCAATFHVTPKSQARQRRMARLQRQQTAATAQSPPQSQPQSNAKSSDA